MRKKSHCSIPSLNPSHLLVALAVARLVQPIADQSAAEEPEHLLAVLTDLLLFALEAAGLEQGTHDPLLGSAVLGHHDVLENRHVGEQADVLEGPGDAPGGDLVGVETEQRLTLEHDVAGGRCDHSRDHVEEGGLPGPVGANDRDDLSLVDMEVKIGECVETTEGHAQVLNVEQTFAHAGATPPLAASSSSSFACAFNHASCRNSS